MDGELELAYKVRTGGMYRCCYDTIKNQKFEVVPKEGTILGCPHCYDSMIYRRGAWEWNPAEHGQT